MSTQTKTRFIRFGKSALSLKETIKANAGLLPGWTEAMLTVTGSAGANITYSGTQTVSNQYIKGHPVIANGAVITFSNCVVEPDIFYYAGDSGVIQCTAGGTVIIDHCVLRQNPLKAWCWLNGIHGKNYTVTNTRVMYTVDGFGIVGPSNADCNVLIRGCYVSDFCYVYWPPAATTSYSDFRGTPEEHSLDRHTHNDGVQLQAGTLAEIDGNVIEGFCNTTIGTIPLSIAGGTLTNGGGLPPGNNPSGMPWTRANFAQPYASSTGQTAGYQVTGQCVLIQCNVGSTVNANVHHNFVDGAVVGVNFNVGGSGAGGSYGQSHDNKYGRKTRIVGGVRSAFRRSSNVTVAVTNETYEDTGLAVPVQVQ